MTFLFLLFQFNLNYTTREPTFGGGRRVIHIPTSRMREYESICHTHSIRVEGTRKDAIE